MQNIRLLSFDLDGTLALSKAAILSEMADVLTQILKDFKIAIISGGDLPQFEKQVVNILKEKQANLENLLLLPTCGSKFFYFEKEEMKKLYSEDLSNEDKERIFEAFNKAITELNLKPETVYGEQVEDRGTQITFSALGQQAPWEVKSVWDIDMQKRLQIKEFIAPFLPEFSIKIGGVSSIDVTRKGIDKEYGMRKLIEFTKLNVEEILFYGDKLEEGGNDRPVLNTGVKCIDVKDENETLELLKEFLKLN